MILWRLRFITAEVVCSIEKKPDGYRLITKRGEDTEREESLPDVTHARLKATALRDQLLSMGFTHDSMIRRS
jgi:hypothetical protein